ncbi:MAG: DUF3850 domain-containing protein [Candidatus Micrarchaeota archaeon]
MSAKIHRKKTWPQYFEAVKKGHKKFDVRLDDFDCKAGDFLVLKEWDPKTEKFTGRELKKRVSFVFKTRDARFWSQKELAEKGLQVFSLE